MRLLILSDVHANIAALRAIPEPADGIVFVGDAVTYGPRPAECVAWLRSRVAHAVQGNHDNAVANNADPRCAPAYRDMADATLQLHRQMLEPEDKTWLQKLPVESYFEFGGAHLYAVHAAPSDPLFRYLPPDMPDGALAEELRHVEADFVLMGHTHKPFARRVDGKVVVNPGSVGQPKHGDPRAAYAIWDDGEVTLGRAEYDVEHAVRQLRGLDLPEPILEDLTRNLLTGGLER